MDRSIVLSILGAAVLGFVGMLLLMPDPIEDEVVRLPWLIERDADGRPQIFGFTLGSTTLAEVRQVFREDGEINLFRSPGPSGTLAAEVYFEQIHLEGLRADFVLTLDADQATLAAMYERGLRISQTGSGSRKVKLDPRDSEHLATHPIRAIVYLPKARLDEALIEQRFGVPSRRITESETGIVHWLYPERGLDIGRNADGRVVMQYVNPVDFGAILEPLATAD
ncbi:MAG: hypothetical protein MZV65_09680 [Chromatiales bacterium]|nr:hypothetical protein [Chromatiales bacterium]